MATADTRVTSKGIKRWRANRFWYMIASQQTKRIKSETLLGDLTTRSQWIKNKNGDPEVHACLS